MITGNDIVKAALDSDLIGIPYSKLDCQALVERVLYLAGLNIPNYRGSNQMWRELVYDRTPIVNANGSGIPLGALVFIVKHDGGEVKRGYHDSYGNAAHVAIYIGDGKTYESTTGGVQISTVKRYTDYGLIKDVDYSNEGKADDSNEGQGSTEPNALRKAMFSEIDSVRSLLRTITKDLDMLSECIENLEDDINEVC